MKEKSLRASLTFRIESDALDEIRFFASQKGLETGELVRIWVKERLAAEKARR